MSEQEQKLSLYHELEKRRSIYAWKIRFPSQTSKSRAGHPLGQTCALSLQFSNLTVLVLFGSAHDRLWSLTLSALKKVVPADKFAPTQQKIDAFSAAAGTILYYEDQAIVANLEANFPSYAHNFQSWSQQASGMLQHTIWTRLAQYDVGASLQHYNELIESDLRSAFEVPDHWRLIAQMPFGSIIGPPKEKSFGDIESRVIVHHQ